MKKITFCLVFVGGLTFTLPAQNEPIKKPDGSYTFSSEQEKEKYVKKLEESYKINLSDPTYPADMLSKQKKDLELAKKGKLATSK